jgi:hypothetical protein
MRMIKILMPFVLLICFATAAPAAKVAKESNGRADIAKLSQKLRQVILLVEKSELACGIRNTLVRRLRLVDDALVSGYRTGASGLLAAWIKRAQSMAAAGTLDATLHAKLKAELQAILEQIGTGWSKKAGPTRHWPPLTSCDPWVAGRPGASAIWNGQEDVMTLISTAIKEIPPPGRVVILVGGLIKICWPSNDPDISTLIEPEIDASVRQLLLTELAQLQAVLNDFTYYENAWFEKCGANPSGCMPSDAESVRSAYLNAVNIFVNARPVFQYYGSAGDYRLKLLDLYVQFETMYLALLSEGVIWGEAWGWTGYALSKPYSDLLAELDSANTASGIGYVDTIYNMGIPYPDMGSVTRNQDEFTKKNAYLRDMALKVLQFAAVWPYMDPIKYPQGNPDFKYTAMIFSDPIGYRGTNGLIYWPYNNVSVPLSHVKVWIQDKFEDYTGSITASIDSMQMTNGPTVGPEMGDTSHDWSYTTYNCDVYPGSVNGPILNISATDDEYLGDDGSHVQSLKFGFANGQFSPLLGSTYDPKRTFYFAYEGWVVADALIMGTQGVHFDWKYKPKKCADCVIFMFRRDDSF